MPATPVIDVERLNVTCGDFAAVRDLSFHVQRCEFHALLGTNGAGKTSATAVYGGPEPLILDEPTTGLDIQSRDAPWAALDRLRDEGSTIVLTPRCSPNSAASATSRWEPRR
jgi:ABC-type multidrug transport system ATPase subunit